MLCIFAGVILTGVTNFDLAIAGETKAALWIYTGCDSEGKDPVDKMT